MKFISKYYNKILRKQSQEVKTHAKNIKQVQKDFRLGRLDVGDNRKFRNFSLRKG